MAAKGSAPFGCWGSYSLDVCTYVLRWFVSHFVTKVGGIAFEPHKDKLKEIGDDAASMLRSGSSIREVFVMIDPLSQ